MPKESELLKTSVCVVGESAAGITAALVLARSGVDVVLVARRHALGGVLLSLGAIETHYDGARSAILTEVRLRILEHYRASYGTGSEQYGIAAGHGGYKMTTFEPHVAEAVFDDLVAAEPRVRLLRQHRLDAIELDAKRIVRAHFVDDQGTRVSIAAESWLDCTDEGDLAAMAGVPWRLGRESRSDYGEPHAGHIFSTRVRGAFPVDAANGILNIRPSWTTIGPNEGSTGVGDGNVQDYSYRLCLTDDPANRLPVPEPVAYDRARFAAIAMTPDEVGLAPYPLQHRWLTSTLRDMIAQDHLFHGHQLPNRKRSWNSSNLTAAGAAYAQASPEQRAQIESQHLQHALGILWFLQHDDAVPADLRALAREWGLAADEFTATAGIPEHLYVREARRIVGRSTFTEHDTALAAGMARAPIHADSIAITEFPNDSLACSTERRLGALPEGQFFLKDTSRPGQVPYSALYSEGVENLLVPLCCSVTHVAWGTIRQTPTQMQIAEAAARATVLALRSGIAVIDVDVAELQEDLVANGSMITFFNDLDMESPEPWLPAFQILATRGFIDSYDARPFEPLDAGTARAWCEIAADLLRGNDVDPSSAARMVHAATDAAPITTPQLVEQFLGATGQYLHLNSEIPTRGGALKAIADVLDHPA